MSGGDNGDVIVEFVQVGNAVKVSAIDAKTGREVSIVGSPRASREELTRVAVNKLKYVMSRD
ncbi:DUF6898 family protein [Emcibacter sp.]|uniref:DUF6898 family protein n=1 Tax=Emcibacter sp. TaxID=1979954 RepID=UPI003A8E883B